MGAITAELVETGEKRDTRGRRVTVRERRTDLVEAYRGSGLTMAAFARQEGIRYSTFAHWVTKAARAPAAGNEPIKFAEMRLPLVAPDSQRTDDRLEVRLPDGTVLRGSRVAEVVALVRALRS